MPESSQFLLKHGALLLFAAIFFEQLGLPIPALPWLLAAGALGAAGKFSMALGLGIVVVASAPADALWFYLGRHRGRQVLGFLCRISLEPDSCVRRTQNIYTRYGMRGVLVAKFLPGFGTMVPPLAGMSSVRASRFLFVAAVGSLLYALCFLGLGFLFSNQIQQIGSIIAQVGGSALVLVGGLLAIYVGYKFWRRQRVLRELRMARITVVELRKKQAAGEPILILDVRSNAELQEDPAVIHGALHLAVADVEHWHHEIPRNRNVILYCSCPNEVTSARVAQLLRRKGITRVRPLSGGIDAWRELNYPVDAGAPGI